MIPFYGSFNKYISFIITFLIIAVLYLSISCHPSNRFRANKKPGNDRIEKKTRYSSSDNSLDSFVSDWLGTPYKYGGLSKRGIDCSGFVYLLMLHVYNKKIPRVSHNQYLKGRKIMRSRLERGDLVFFKRIRSRGIDHVGIYLGDDTFAHASEKKGIIISLLSEKYYKKRYAGACRY